MITYTLVKVTPLPPGNPYDSYRWLFDHTEDSANNNTFWHNSDIKNGRNINILGGDSDS